ncbi:hypothetical protein [Bythopirellula polymerisocia]|uniref:Uncharacterized protein n=1 Tax=Bythopirellula polymerisocia TaxID=2528003 RepID=A0A5C6CFX4_9BACT|nr:hypothetical protein [Bythopirellula polymerisocia]TWU23843.1 hypothetical protein Pla144_40200 [Bythopirellula polymerisocia]
MARSRNIKPGFFSNEMLVSLPFPARLLFIGLWTIADREGRLEDRPLKIKMQIFPGDDVDVDAALNQLASGEDPLIVRYVREGISIIQVVKWQNHQRPHHQEAASVLPSMEDTSHQGTNSTRTKERSDTHEPAKRSIEGISNQESVTSNQESDRRESGESSTNPRKPKVFEPIDMQLAEWMWDKIKLLQPDRSPPKLESWAEDFRLMREIDKRDEPGIRKLFEWVNQDPFWQINVLSPKKLREKWDDLELKRRAASLPNNTRPATGESAEPTGSLFK